MGHLDSQRSLPAMGPDRSGLSALAKKLRLVAGQRVLVLDAPDGYLDLLKPAPTEIRTDLRDGGDCDAVLLFVRDSEQLRRTGPAAIRATKAGGLLWVVYPKGGPGVGVTDLPATPTWVQRDVLGELTGERGYKPVAFVAVDETWTALRFKHV